MAELGQKLATERIDDIDLTRREARVGRAAARGKGEDTGFDGVRERDENAFGDGAERRELAALGRKLDLHFLGLARCQARSLLGQWAAPAGGAVGHVRPGLPRPLIEIAARGEDSFFSKLRDCLLGGAKALRELGLSRPHKKTMPLRAPQNLGKFRDASHPRLVGLPGSPGF